MISCEGCIKTQNIRGKTYTKHEEHEDNKKI